MRGSIVLLSVMALAGLTASGCMATRPHHTTSLVPGAGAVVYGVLSPEPRPPVVQIDAIDKQLVPPASRADALVVEPGERVLALTGSCFRGYLMDIAAAELRVTLEAGREYEIHVAHAEGGLAFSLRDADSHRVVGSKLAAVTRTIMMPPTAEGMTLR